MASWRILSSWIGHNDLLSAAAEKDQELQKKVLSALNIERPLPLRKQFGPIRTLLDQEHFDDIHLLGDYPKWLRMLYEEWLNRPVTMHSVSLSDPSDYGQILVAVESVLEKIERKPGSEFSFLLTPGTPSMAATWILVGKSRYDATFWQTHDGRAKKSEVPFDVMAGFASELAAVPDVNLLHLFSGAKKKGQPGGFEQSDGGTLFLDEVGECSPAMQAALLRVLQPPQGKGPCYREYSPVGDFSDVRHSDVRIVSATNRNLITEVEEGRFREDLFYRLAVIKVKLPALRSRKSDIPELIDILMLEINEDFRRNEKDYQYKTISDDAKRFVRSYDWPGNVRQLKNTLVEAAVMCPGLIIGPGDVKAAIADVPGKTSGLFDQELGSGFCLQTLLEDVHRKYLERAMEEADGVKTRAAELLGMSSYQTLDAQLKRLKVRVHKINNDLEDLCSLVLTQEPGLDLHNLMEYFQQAESLDQNRRPLRTAIYHAAQRQPGWTV